MKDISKLIDILEKKGLTKHASEMKEAFSGYVSPSYEKVMPKSPTTVAPKNPNQPFITPGETYTEIGKDIDPNKNITRIHRGPNTLTPLNTPLSAEELVQSYHNGELNLREAERYINDITNNPKATPIEKNTARMALKDLKESVGALTNPYSFDEMMNIYRNKGPNSLDLRKVENLYSNLKKDPKSLTQKNTVGGILSTLRWNKCAGDIKNISVKLASLGDTKNSQKLYNLIKRI